MTSTLPPAPDPDQLARDIATLQHSIRVARAAPEPPSDELLAALETAHEELRVADEEMRAQQDVIGRLVESHRSLRVQQERTMGILPVPVVVTDMRGVVRSVNAAAAHLIDVRVVHLLGKPLFTLFAPDDRAELRRLVAAASRGDTDGLLLRRTATLVPRRGEPVLVDLTGSLQLPGAADGEIAWVVLSAGERGEGQARVTDVLARLATLPRRDADTSGLLAEAASICASTLDAEVTISLGAPLAPTTVASSSGLAQLCDGAQVAAGDGPSADAWTTSQLVSTRSWGTDARWPRLRDHTPDGVASVAAVPIESSDRVVGVLTAYRPASAPASEEVMGLLAVTVGAVLSELELHHELARLERDMEVALSSRSVIDQAKGIVMASRGLDAAAAWEHLVQLSSTQHVKVRDVAEQIVSRASGRG